LRGLVLALIVGLPVYALGAGVDRFAPVERFLNAHCVECHGVKAKKADLVLNVYHDEASLLKDRKIWQQAIQMVHEGEMPPAKRPRPSDAELAAFLDGVGAIFDEADRTAKPDPGRVTIRRLNRVEYNNTIRDLVGVEFQPAEDFPSDDVGHGFDNIADVLSLSPVLMERYLAAAESVVQRAIVVDPPKPPVRRQSAKYLEPASKDVPQGRFRPLVTGSLFNRVTFSNDGQYVMRVRAYAPQVDEEPPRIALQMDGAELLSVDATGEDEKHAVTYEAKFTGQPGEHRFAVSILNPADGENKRTVFVESIIVEGPADTRPASQRRLLAVTPGKTKGEQTREVLTRFASHAYRRPATADEINRLAGLVEQCEARGDKWEAGVQMAFQAILVSPKFLFRVELDDRPQSLEAHPIDEYALASRLSYFIWATMPDDELFALAAKGELTKNLEPQVRRMLKDPRASSLVDEFAMQWLQLRRLRTVSPDTKLFPAFDERLRKSMTTETELFLKAIVQEDRSILDLISADFTFLDRTLARHYGIIDTMGNRVGDKKPRPGGRPIDRDFVRVSLPPDSDRGGILTQASVLTVTSNPTRTSPVKRGKWVLEQLLGAPPPPPPPNVPELKADDKALTGTLRQRMEQHRENPACAACHARMDPLGFAMENFDAVGAFRQKDGQFVIDPSGTLPGGQSFKGPAELRSILKEKKGQFARCLAEKMTTYALGRGIEFYDRRAIDKICAALDKDNYHFSRLVIEIVQSDPFRLRRGTEQNKP
jgi:hypothetical protein